MSGLLAIIQEPELELAVRETNLRKRFVFDCVAAGERIPSSDELDRWWKRTAL